MSKKRDKKWYKMLNKLLYRLLKKQPLDTEGRARAFIRGLRQHADQCEVCVEEAWGDCDGSYE